MDQQGAQIAVSTFSDAEQSGAAAARSLFGHKAKPRRELTPILEGASVADRGDKRSRRHRTNPFDLAETLADLAVAIEFSDLSVVASNPHIQFGQFFPQLCHKPPDKMIESAVFIVVDEKKGLSH